jgi:hypothetical protein
MRDIMNTSCQIVKFARRSCGREAPRQATLANRFQQAAGTIEWE